MANYYAAARSNYFRVKDLEKFLEELPDGVEVQESHKYPGYLCLIEAGGDSSGWRFDIEDEDGEILEDGLIEIIAKHLTPGDVAVLIETGAEKLRYLNGYAVAVNSRGETVGINLDQIYEMASTLGNTITRATY